MDQLSAIKWTIMEKAKFGSMLKRKKAFVQQHGLVLCVAAAGGQMVRDIQWRQVLIESNFFFIIVIILIKW